MPLAASPMPAGLELIAAIRQGVTAAEALLDDARRAVAGRVAVGDRAIVAAFDR